MRASLRFGTFTACPLLQRYNYLYFHLETFIRELNSSPVFSLCRQPSLFELFLGVELYFLGRCLVAAERFLGRSFLNFTRRASRSLEFNFFGVKGLCR